MQILSHRGYWLKPEQKNTQVAFEHSFALGFGTETDVRDYQGKLVISHDIATKNSILLEEFLTLYKKYSANLPLALNIKADGLQENLKSELKYFDIENYFVFDMSVPDGLMYLKAGLKTFTRQSEYEKQPSFYEEASGVWLDEFHSHWIDLNVIKQHLQHGKRVCIVSPDLHKRDHLFEWQHYKDIITYLDYDVSNLMICTDYPEEARRFFYDS